MRLLLPSLLAGAVSARVFDSLAAVPKGWVEVRAAEPEEAAVLKIALRQQQPVALERAVLEISTPGHAKYGKHMTRDELRTYTAPSKRALSEVTAWVRDFGGIKHSVDNDWISISTNVRTANELLNATFAWYEYETGSGPQLRTLSYSVPDAIAEHVDLVQPTTRFGQPAAQGSTIFEKTVMEDPVMLQASVGAGAQADSCETTITPDCLRALYNINYTATAEGNLVAFASYLEQYARYTDLEVFEETYVPAAKGQNFTVQLINDGKDDQDSPDDSTEANLDMQYVLGVSHPIPVLEYSTGGRGPLVPTKDQPKQPGSNEPYLEFLTYLLALPEDAELPQTLSTSYGEEEQSIPEEYALKVCNMFMQLGARGVSVLFSSGDSGPGYSCQRTSDNATFFNPTFPAGCPYVTAVGGTTGMGPERAVGFSSGGFSIFHAQPDYQKTAVSKYLTELGDTYADFFNASGRGIPDVAAQGQAFAVVDKGRVVRVSGTSASSPAFAGIVALLNAARKAQGEAPLGFLNPWLYNNTAALQDITEGAGVGCNGVSPFGAGGAQWNATRGWDPVTGLGTPKFDKLLEAAAPGTKNE